MSASTEGAALVGKAPWRDEFLRVTNRSSELRALDDWLFRNADAVGSVIPEQEPPPYGFLMRLERGNEPLRPIAGVLSPSNDRAGRAYPLAVAAPIGLGPEVHAHPEVAPIVLESYWNLAVDIVTSAKIAPPAADDPRLERLVAEPLEPGPGALELYREWAARTTPDDLCEELERPGSWLIDTARDIFDLAAAPGRVAAPSLPSIRVPLGHAGGGALCFWLDLVRRAAGAHAGVPSFFWTHDGEAGQALVCLGAPPDTTLSALWRPESAGRAVRDFTLAPGSEPAAASADGGSLASFLERMQARVVALPMRS